MAFQLFGPRKIYYVTANGLTTEELRETSLRNYHFGSITSVLVEFNSPVGVTYYAKHVRQFPDKSGRFFYGLPASSYIDLFCRKKEFDEVDFVYVESTLESIAKQKLEGVQLGSRSNGITEDSDYGPIRAIDVKRDILTNYRIAELTDEYKKYFDKVEIRKAFFQKAQESDLKHLDLPSEKVSIRGTRHLHPDDWKNLLL